MARRLVFHTRCMIQRVCSSVFFCLLCLVVLYLAPWPSLCLLPWRCVALWHRQMTVHVRGAWIRLISRLLQRDERIAENSFFKPREQDPFFITCLHLVIWTIDATARQESIQEEAQIRPAGLRMSGLITNQVHCVFPLMAAMSFPKKTTN